MLKDRMRQLLESLPPDYPAELRKQVESLPDLARRLYSASWYSDPEYKPRPAFDSLSEQLQTRWFDVACAAIDLPFHPPLPLL